MSETTNQAAAGILEVMRVVQEASKTAESPQLKYKYVAHASLVAAIRAAMIEQGLIMVPVDGESSLIPNPFKDGWHGTVGYTFEIQHVESGHIVRIGPVYGEGFDAGDKTIPKANTNAHKYAMLMTFMLPSKDDPEADGETDTDAQGKPVGQESGRTRDIPVFVLANAFGACTDLDVESEKLVDLLGRAGVTIEIRKAKSGKDIEWAVGVSAELAEAAQKDSADRVQDDIAILRERADALLGLKHVDETPTDDIPY